MTVYAYPAVVVGFRNARIVLKLPEASAKDSALRGRYQSYADTAKLCVAAACHHGSTLGKAGNFRSFLRYVGNNGAAFVHLRENIGFQTAFLHDGAVPVSCGKVKNAGGGAVAGLDGHNAGQLQNQPVVEHAHICGFFVNFRHLVFYPENSGKRPQRIGLAGNLVNFPFQLGRLADQLHNFVIGAGVHIGAGPDFMEIPVIENDSLTHAGGGDRSNF